MKFRHLLLAIAVLAGLALFWESDREAKEAVGFSALATAFCVGVVDSRTLQDLNLQATWALPAANANNYSGVIDTAEVEPGRVDCVELFLSCPATPALTDTDSITFTFYSSPDNANWTASPDIPAQIMTGAGGDGAAALLYQCKLPIGIGRYLKVNAAVANGGGNNTAVSATVGLVF